MIFWIDNTSIYDCRTYSLIKPQQYDVAIILDYIKQEQQQNRIDVKEKLPKLLKTLALLLIIHNKNDIFRLLQILASKDFNQTKLYNDFMNNPAALWYIEQMKVEPVQMIMHQYILGEYKFLEGLFQKIINSYEQYLLKLQNGQGTPEFNLQGESKSNQNQTSSNTKKGRYHKNQKQENQNYINQIQVSEVQLELPNNQIKKNPEEVKSNQDSMFQNLLINTEQALKQNLEVIQQQQINKEKTLITSIEIEDKTPQQSQQMEQNRQQSIQQQLTQNQQVIQNQKYQNNQENPKGSYFSEQQKISLESVFKDDLPDQKLLGIPTIQSDNVQQQQTLPSSKSKSNPKQQEQITEKSEKIINTEQTLANNIFNNEQVIDTLSEKEQQEFDFSQDTELIKLYDLLKEKCQQIYWWSKFQDRCHKAMSDKELELIMFEKLPILMKRWAIKTKKNVTEIETTLTRLHRTPIQDTTNKLLDNQNSEGYKIIHISSSPQKFEHTKLIEENSLNQNQKNQIKNSYDFQQPQIHKQQDHLDSINKESNNFTSRVDEDTVINQNQQLKNEIQEVTPYQIIDIDDEIFKSFQGDINKKGQSSKIIKTASNRLNSEITKSKQQQPENVDKQFKLQETQQQLSHSDKSKIICIESSNDEIISNMQQPTPQQQTGECTKIQNQNIVCSVQQGINQMNDDIDNLFQDNNDIYSPDSIVSSSSILISDQSSIQFGEIQANKKQIDSVEQINQQQNKDSFKEPEKNMEKHNIKEQREEEQKSRDKKHSESDIDVKEKQKNKNNKRQHQKEKSENTKTKSKKDSKEKKRAKSSQQYKRKDKSKDKSKDKKKRNSSERKSGQDILKQMQAEKDAKERQKEELKKKEKEKIHQENIKKAEQRLQKLRFEEIEYQKEYDYIQQQSMQKEIKERELKQQQQQQQYQHQHHQHKKYQQSYQNYKNDNQIQEQNQTGKPYERQVQDQQYVNTDTKYKHHNQNHNQQNQQKIQESQQYGNRSQQYNQGHEKSMIPHSQQNDQWDSQKNQQFHQRNYKQNDRHQRTQNSHDQVNSQQNQQQQRQNSYAFPLEQYGIQEFLTKKDQTIQKNIQKSIVNPVQYDIEQPQSPSLKQNNYRKQQQQQQSQQQYPQQFQQQQYQSQQQQQPFQQQQQYQYPQQQQFNNIYKPRDNKFRNHSPHRQQGYNRQKQHYQNHQEPHIKKQRKYNPYHEQYSNNQSFNYNQGPSNMNAQPYSYQDQMNNNQIPYKNSSSYPNSPIHSSNQPSKQQMFEFFCSMFYDKFQQAE